MSRAAHTLVRLAAEEYFGTPCPGTVLLPGGKPDFAPGSGLHFSLSHSCGAVLAGVSEHELGVDLELVREVNVRFARRLFSEKMLSAFGYYGGWTLRESAYKLGAPGHLMSMELAPADGPFIAAQKNLSLRFRGSSNQRLIDIKKTRAAGAVVLWDEAQ